MDGDGFPDLVAAYATASGGIDVCNIGSGGFTMTNMVVDQNTNTTAYGGVNFDSAAPANGTNVIIGSTLSGNKTTALVDTNGGGINLYADAQNVNITNSTISGNIAAGQGGGVFVRHTNGGAITISGTTISGNTAASRGGGVSNGNLLASSLAILNDSAILNNVSQGTAASFESRGGGIFILTGTGIGTITNDDVAVSITTVTLPNPSVGAAYSQTVAATGGSGPYTFSLSAGALPTGIFLSTAGVLSGTANQVGSFSSTIAATDANSQTASRAYTLNVAAPTLTLTPPAGALTATFGIA